MSPLPWSCRSIYSGKVTRVRRLAGWDRLVPASGSWLGGARAGEGQVHEIPQRPIEPEIGGDAAGHGGGEVAHSTEIRPELQKDPGQQPVESKEHSLENAVGR